MRSLVVQAKELLEEAGFAKDGKAVVLGGSIIAGFCAAACSLPFDFVKTRIQKMDKQADGSYPYKSPVDCAVKTFREEGFLKFYTGFPTYCLRCVSVCLHPSANIPMPDMSRISQLAASCCLWPLSSLLFADCQGGMNMCLNAGFARFLSPMYCMQDCASCRIHSDLCGNPAQAGG